MKGIWQRPGLVQVAGIRHLDEARMLLDAGVDLLGFPLGLDFHEEDIPGHEAARIVRILGLEERGVLITYLTRPGEIAALVRQIKVRAIQLHGRVNRGSIHELRKRVPGLSVIKSLIVREGNLGELKTEIRVLEDLVACSHPQRMKVTVDYKIRGGVHTVVYREYTAPRHPRR